MDDLTTPLDTSIDIRLVDIWGAMQNTPLSDALEESDVARAIFSACIRAAWGQGYVDAIEEYDRGRRGALAAAHGITI